MFINNAYAQATEVVEVVPTETAGFGILGTVGYIAVLGLLFYFLFIRPQRKQMQEHKKAVDALKVGDVVLLNSGIEGTIKKIGEKDFVVEIAKGVEVKVLKAYVVGKV
jgi:preprotein translocase subunit YajC